MSFLVIVKIVSFCHKVVSIGNNCKYNAFVPPNLFSYGKFINC